MKTEEENYRRFYPDLIANGGVLNWVRRFMAQTPTVEVNGWGQNYAYIQCAGRSTQLSFLVFERRFTFDFWEEGKVLANGQHTDFVAVVQTIKVWVTGNKSAEEFERETGFVKAWSNHPKSNPKPGAYLISGDKLNKVRYGDPDNWLEVFQRHGNNLDEV